VVSHIDTAPAVEWVVPAAVFADMGHCAGLSHLGGVMKLLPQLRHDSEPSLPCHTALYECPA